MTSRWLSKVLLISLVAWLVGCSHVQGEPVTQAVAAANEAYTKMLNAGDGAGVASQFTEDAYLMIPNLGLISGREAIRASVEQTEGQWDAVKLESRKVVQHGNVAYELGTWKAAIGGSEELGHYLTLWRAEDGKWLRAGSCSVPEQRPQPLKIEEGATFAHQPMATKEVRVVGDAAQAERAVARLGEYSRTYVEVFNSDDPAAMRAYVDARYAADAVAMVPGVSPFDGRAAIAASCSGAMAACSGLRVDPAVVELGAEGDMAFVLSTYANEVRNERGDVVPTSGNQLAVWSLGEDGWRVVASCVTDVVSTPDINYEMQ